MAFEDYLQELNRIQILSEKEEKELWQAYKEKGDKESRAHLIESYQPLVFKLVMKMNPTEGLRMDLIQEASVGLIEAVERYNPNKGIGFATYASFRIRGQIINYLQRVEQNLLSLDSFFVWDDENLNLISQISDLHAEEENISLEERVSWAQSLQESLERLPEKEKKVIYATFMENKVPEEIAEELKMSIPHVYRLQKKGLRRIRGMLSKLRHKSKTD